MLPAQPVKERCASAPKSRARNPLCICFSPLFLSFLLPLRVSTSVWRDLRHLELVYLQGQTGIRVRKEVENVNAPSALSKSPSVVKFSAVSLARSPIVLNQFGSVTVFKPPDADLHIGPQAAGTAIILWRIASMLGKRDDSKLK